MAKKVPAPKKKAKPKETGENDLAILHPEKTVTIADRAITMREYGFVEGLHLRPYTQPIADALYETVASGSEPPELEEILGILAGFSDSLVTLLAVAADVDEDWIRELNEDNGHTVMMLWWSVNGPFFIRRVFNRKVARMAVQKLRDGQTSMPPSSDADTET